MTYSEPPILSAQRILRLIESGDMERARAEMREWSSRTLPLGSTETPYAVPDAGDPCS